MKIERWEEANQLRIRVEQKSPADLEAMGVAKWPTWTKEISRFDWFYDEPEQCLFLEGQVTVETQAGPVSFGKGDFVTFPKGLACVWNVETPVKKHYKFG
ncbi:MAG TPA: cupin domain-containing protein [Kiritimatiellia bacterium]|jgi:hypothetical protein